MASDRTSSGSADGAPLADDRSGADSREAEPRGGRSGPPAIPDRYACDVRESMVVIYDNGSSDAWIQSDRWITLLGSKTG